VLDSIESVAAGSGNDSLLGSAGANDLSGGAGNDSISGGNGNDFLFGEDGNDGVQGGGGDDTLAGGTTHFETFDEEYMDDGDYALMNSWLADDGADTLDGGSSNDTLLVRTLSFQQYHYMPEGLADARVDLALGTLRLTLPDAGTDTLISIENVVTGYGNDTITGSSGSNRIDTGSGANLVLAGGGNDTVIGGTYALYDDLGQDGYGDRLYGEGGDDLLRGNGAGLSDYWWQGGRDYLDGGTGDDTLVGEVGGTHMAGGAGADTFIFNNEIEHYDVDGEWPHGPEGVVEDFDHSAGDRIRIALTSPDFSGTPTFVGEEARMGDIGAFELGFVRLSDGDGLTATLVRFNNVDPGDEAYDGQFSLTITLAGYAGALTASDFLFV
jgi:Ca2+-binding RTX toxin-like protein